MGRGIIHVDADKAFNWFVDGKRLEDIKELLLLPEDYSVEKVYQPDSDRRKGMCVIVLSPDIPEIPDRDIDADVSLTYREEGGKRELGQITIKPWQFARRYGEAKDFYERALKIGTEELERKG